MESFKVSLGSGSPREGTITKTPQAPNRVYQNKKNEGPTNFDTSFRCMLWDSRCTHSTNPYFDLYTEYKPLDNGDVTKFNGIEELIKPKGT